MQYPVNFFGNSAPCIPCVMDASQSMSRRERCLLSEVVYLREMLEALMEEKSDAGRLRQEIREAREIISTYEETIKTLMQEVVELRQEASSDQNVVNLQAQLIASESKRVKEVTALQNALHKKDREIARLQTQLAEVQRAVLH
ncbi:Dynein gamma chain/ flagellar outer arm [Giardia duodenalis assemblage B]|uniref:Dynein gamma chain/ flagellar outer arm n=1 Tax=Giardia duodenalis assemblage B TaxID=1394984 RepID=A0A132NXD7_GIAIN|nr:Dynein gamma chain/ flagellar outer arm [Giardia intestinalis assemblage B]